MIHDSSKFLILSPVHTTNHLSVCSLVSVRLAQGSDTPQISHHILRLPKVHFLQEVPHLQLHILNHLANVNTLCLH